MIIDGLIAFGAMFALDFVWAVYTQYVIAHRPWAAASAASGIMLLNGAVTLLYVADPAMLGFAAVGAFVGTAAAIKWARLLTNPWPLARQWLRSIRRPVR